MKKILSFVLVLLLIAALLAGCTSETEETLNTDTTPTQAAVTTQTIIYKDGTYTAKGEVDERGWTPEISITVKDGKISDVKYDEVSGMKKSQDTEYHKNFKEKANVDLLAAYKAIQDSLVTSQDITKIDGYTGATKATDSFKALVAIALKDAKDGDKYKDGSYKASGEEDERGWKPQVSITVEDGKITAATYDEVSSKTFVYKSQDTAYQKRFLEKETVHLLTAYDALQKSLIAKQDPAQVDAYSGATAASTDFVELAKKALESAK